MTSTRFRLRIWIGAIAAIFALAEAALAIPLTLTGPIPGNTVAPVDRIVPYRMEENRCVVCETR